MSFQRQVIAAILAVSLGWGIHVPAACQENSPPPAAEAAPAESPSSPAGDVIHMRNGRKLEGFRIIRQTATEVILQLTAEGLELRLPMSQVSSIERGTGGGEDETVGRQGEEERELHGVKLAPSLNEKLQEPLPGGPMRLEQRDYVAILLELSERSGVPLRIADAVHTIPADERRWTTVIPAQSSLFSVLNELLLRDFPNLRVSYTYEAVLLDAEMPDANGPNPQSVPANQ